jgi:hypothetical protein
MPRYQAKLIRGSKGVTNGFEAFEDQIANFFISSVAKG